jgi:hypothetical protein
MNQNHFPIPSRCVAKDPTSLGDSINLCHQKTLREDYPLRASIQSNIPIYTLPPFSSISASAAAAYQDEWHHILLSGPGVFVTKATLPDHF